MRLRRSLTVTFLKVWSKDAPFIAMKIRPWQPFERPGGWGLSGTMNCPFSILKHLKSCSGKKPLGIRNGNRHSWQLEIRMPNSNERALSCSWPTWSFVQADGFSDRFRPEFAVSLPSMDARLRRPAIGAGARSRDSKFYLS